MKGRNVVTQEIEFEVKPIDQMTDREIAEETLLLLRTAGAALAKFQQSGMGSMIAGMIPGLHGPKRQG